MILFIKIPRLGWTYVTKILRRVYSYIIDHWIEIEETCLPIFGSPISI